MPTAAQLRLLARTHRARAAATQLPARRAMLEAMALEFERDAQTVERDERREAYRRRALMQIEGSLAGLAA